MEHQPSTLSNQPRPSKRFVIVSWALVAAWAFLIFFMSSNTGTGLNTGLGIFSSIYRAMQAVQEQLLGPGVDALSSIAHFCEYTMFGALLANALRCHMPLRRACLIAIACASLYGVSDEVHQLFVPERMCDPVDWMVDTAGSALGSGIAYAVLRKSRAVLYPIEQRATYAHHEREARFRDVAVRAHASDVLAKHGREPALIRLVIIQRTMFVLGLHVH